MCIYLFIRKSILVLVFLAILLTGCSRKNVTSIYNDNDKISSSSNSFNLDVEEQTIEGEKFVGIINKLEGMDTIWTYKSDEDKDLEMTYLLNVGTGKVKLVLISPVQLAKL